MEAIFIASRVAVDDPVQASGGARREIKEAHGDVECQAILTHCTLKDRNGSDRSLADDHLWAGGGTTAGNGVYCQPNIPTEECFTTPHKDRVNGTVRARSRCRTKVRLIENIAVRSRMEGSLKPRRPL